jgi:hypothetical protein
MWTTIAFYVFLGWVFVYWLPCLAILIYVVRKDEDITVKDLIQMILATAIVGPLVAAGVTYEHLREKKFFDRVAIKKCTKKDVWKALGGLEE